MREIRPRTFLSALLVPPLTGVHYCKLLSKTIKIVDYVCQSDLVHSGSLLGGKQSSMVNELFGLFAINTVSNGYFLVEE